MAVYGPGRLSTGGTSSVTAATIKVDMADSISFLEPSAAPLLRLTGPSSDGKANLRKESCSNPTIYWLEDESVPRWDSNTGGALTTETTIPVAYRQYFNVGTKIYNPLTGEVMVVNGGCGAGETGAGSLTVTRDNTDVHYGNIAGSQPLLILRHTAAEGSTYPTLIQSLASAPYNYTEIIKTTFGVTNTLKNTDMYGMQELDKQRFLKGIEHAIAIEHRLLFGVRNTPASGTELKRSMGGVMHYLDASGSGAQISNAGAGLTETEFNAWLQLLFTYGSSNKLVLCGADMIATLNTFPSGKVRINDMLTKKYGMNIQEWISPFGTAYLIFHKLLEGTTWTKRGIGLDIEKIKYRYLQNRDTYLETNIQTAGTDGEIDQYLTEASFELKTPKAHGYVYYT